MASVNWEIKGREFTNCNCIYACPCQFNALPDKGYCEAIQSIDIEKGNFGDVKLDGLRAAGIFKWPGPFHFGNGTMQLIIDRRADARQRDALQKIMTGAETEDLATMWWVYSKMSPTKLEPVWADIEFDVDIDARRAKVSAPGVFESKGEPILNPVTGLEHRVRIDLPNGFEYRLAEIGSGTSTTQGPLKLNLKNTY